jgi:hypothetical protein
MLLWVVESEMYSSCRGTADFGVLIRVRCCCSLNVVLCSSDNCVFWVVDIHTKTVELSDKRGGRIEVRKEGDGGNFARL